MDTISMINVNLIGLHESRSLGTNNECAYCFLPDQRQDYYVSELIYELLGTLNGSKEIEEDFRRDTFIDSSESILFTSVISPIDNLLYRVVIRQGNNIGSRSVEVDNGIICVRIPK